MRGKRFGAGRSGIDPRRRMGERGEEIACRYLRRRLYLIVETNFRTRYGEIDIIARRGNTVAFVEVKARRDKLYGEPFEAVDVRKQEKIKSMAEAWLMAHLRDKKFQGCQYRFDVISILLGKNGKPDEIVFLKDAFR